VGELKPTMISIQIADRSIKYLIGMLEDVPLQIGKFFIPYHNAYGGGRPNTKYLGVTLLTPRGSESLLLKIFETNGQSFP